MIKKKLASFAAAAFAVCSITATAYAAGKHPLPRVTLVEGDTIETTKPRTKDDNLYAVAYVDEGLDNGDTFLTFAVVDNKTGALATGSENLWVNDRCRMNYKSGYGIKGDLYRFRISMQPQANAHSITFKGSWTP